MDSGKSAPQLRVRHLMAIDLLAQGMSYEEVASAVEVDRSNLYRWRRNPVFQAELNKRRGELWDSVVDRVRWLGPKAIGLLGKEIEQGNVKAALGLLRLMSPALRQLGTFDSVDAGDLAARAALRRGEVEALALLVSEADRQAVLDELDDLGEQQDEQDDTP
jgi:hypothetical protein